MPLEPVNYMMIALGGLVIASSYLGMFIEQAVDGIFALFVSPVTLVGAYLWITYAILYRPTSKKKRPVNQAET